MNYNKNEEHIGNSETHYRNKIVDAIITLGAIAFAAGIILTKIWRGYLTPEDFEKAKWIKYNNKSGEVWNLYMNEDIFHNSYNWKAYMEEVRKKNPSGLEGRILVPDLDKDGCVGKSKKDRVCI